MWKTGTGDAQTTGGDLVVWAVPPKGVPKMPKIKSGMPDVEEIGCVEGGPGMSVSGGWTLHFSWGCTNSYSQSNITFNNNGTFGGTLTGRWIQQNGTLLLSFD